MPKEKSISHFRSHFGRQSKVFCKWEEIIHLLILVYALKVGTGRYVRYDVRGLEGSLTDIGEYKPT